MSTSPGWLPDLPDQRDLAYKPSNPKMKIPASVDLRSLCPPVYTQGNLGACTSNAVAALFDFMRKKEGKPFINPSRLFLYYNCRTLTNTVKSDGGAYIRDAIKVLVKQGVCREAEWPYKIEKFASKPAKLCYDNALRYQALKYHRIDSSKLVLLKACLAEGYPFVFGFTMYSNFAPNVVPMPGTAGTDGGGHAVMCVGYNEAKRLFLCRNSRGVTWGEKGYFWMPYDYLTNTNLSEDFWTLRDVE